MSRDQQMVSSLEEKLQVYAETIALHWKVDASQLESRIRVQPHADEVPQAAAWLAAALQESRSRVDLPVCVSAVCLSAGLSVQPFPDLWSTQCCQEGFTKSNAHSYLRIHQHQGGLLTEWTY